MRRVLGWALLVVFLGQSSALPALAATTAANSPSTPAADLAVAFQPLVAAVETSQLYAQATGDGNRYAAMHMAPPQIFKKPHKESILLDMKKVRGATPRPARPGRIERIALPRRLRRGERTRIDPFAEARNFLRPGQPGVTPVGRPGVRPALGVHSAARNAAVMATTTSTDQGVGINHWWTYEERPIPGLGKAMVNVSNGNLLVQALDVDIPERGIDLAFQRTWNSQSQHDINADDGSDAAIFGNKWTNTFDAHLVYRAGSPNVISVYDIDGTRYDYTADGNGGWIPPPGIYDVLQPEGATGCNYWWTKKSGTSYYFHSPSNGLGSNGNCGTPVTKVGHLYEIVGRNDNNNIAITYQYAAGNDESTPENIVGITATHSDGDVLNLTFTQVGNNNELSTISMLNGGNVTGAQILAYYKYDTNGNLLESYKPSVTAEPVPADPYFPGIPIPIGYVPTTFNTSPTAAASMCGPRGTIGLYRVSDGITGQETDGSCAVFTFDSTYKVDGWYDVAVMNFTPHLPNPFAPGVPSPAPDTSGTLLQISVPHDQWITVNQAWLAGVGTGSTAFSDSDGHTRVWTLDSTGRATQTQEWVGTTKANALVTSATWGGPTPVKTATAAQLAHNNNILSETDAAGNTTSYQYDPNGNTIEVAKAAVGGVRPIQTYNYDYQTPAPSSTTQPWDAPESNNLVAACDANYNSGSGFVSSTSDSLCPANVGTTRIAYTPTPAEPFGELISIKTPCVGDACRSPGNTITIAYSPSAQACGGADCGLPTSVTGTSTAQNGVTYAPLQSCVYTAQGALSSYNTGSGTWSNHYNVNYYAINRNRPSSRTDPDSYTSVTSYNQDGTVGETQTPYQVALGIGILYSYDADGNPVTETHHKGGSYGSGGVWLAAPQSTSKFYDGLDRLVEVVLPNGGTNVDGSTNDVYKTSWVTRYIYDLSQPGAPAPGTGYPAPTVDNVPVAAYGNLYKTQEYLPSNPVVTWPGTQITPTTVQDVNGAAFDALDRPVMKYRYSNLSGVETLMHEVLTYDGSPDSQGLLYSDAVPGGTLAKPNFPSCSQANIECKTYTYDSNDREKQVTFTVGGASDPNTPNRTTTYDLNGRPLTITSSADSDTYIYDVEGRLKTDTKADGAFFTYDYYPNGKPAAVSTAISTDTFQYEYANDGSSLQQEFSMPNAGSGHSGSIVNTLTAAGRVKTRTDKADGGTGMVTTFKRSSSGMITEVDFPGVNEHSGLQYDAEGELLVQSVTATSSGAPYTYQQTWAYNQRGEIIGTNDGNTILGPGGRSSAMYYANGVQVLNASGVLPGVQNPGDQPVLSNLAATFDAGMGAIIFSGYTGTITNASGMTKTNNLTTVGYDAAGRNVGSSVAANSILPGGGSSSTGYSTSRIYDVENHVTSSSGAPSYTGVGVGPTFTKYTWGTNGHPVKIGSGITSQTGYDLVEWDGDAVLYTRKSGTALDDVKIGTLADVTFSNTGYEGVTFYDRGNDGSVAYCHNNTGVGGYGDGDPFVTRSKWASTGTNVCGPSTIPPGATFQYPLQIEWSGSYVGTPNVGVGNGWILGESRADGINDGVNTIQGIRAYDANSGQWSTPDIYSGNVGDPMSQKTYMWNGNNAISFSDPSGFSPLPCADCSNGDGGGESTFDQIGDSTGTRASFEQLGATLGTKASSNILKYDPWGPLDQAAEDATRSYHNIAIRNKAEYGGKIACNQSETSCGWNLSPDSGNHRVDQYGHAGDSIDLWQTPDMPGLIAKAYWHDHWDPNGDEGFSPDDYSFAYESKLPLYVGTRRGNVFETAGGPFYDPHITYRPVCWGCIK